MKITTILGSPRRHGNTATVLAWFEERVGPEHTINHIDLNDYRVAGCLGCENCQGVYNQPGCSQADDAEDILQQILDADLTVYASPVYSWGFTAQMKALIDRHFCLIKWRDGEVAQTLAADKRCALLLTCGGSAEENTDLLIPAFRRQIEYSQGVIVGEYVVPNCSTPDQLGAEAVAVAERMARELT